MMPTDKFSVRAVIIVLALISLGSLAAMIGLALLSREQEANIHDAFVFSTGALIGVIARTSTNEDHPQDVNVVNPPTDPVVVNPIADDIAETR